MYCSNCGKAIKDTDLYCSFCGHKVGNDEKRHEPVNEEVIYNPPQTDKEPLIFGRREQPPYNISDPSAGKPKTCDDDFDFVWNVHKFPAAGPRETEDISFDWNPKQEENKASQFASGEDINLAGFSNLTSDQRKEKFNTYNKSREEFQKLLDREYVRLNQRPPAHEPAQYESAQNEPAQKPPVPRETIQREPLQPVLPAQMEPANMELAPAFDPIRHLQEMELERKRERDLFYAELEQQDQISEEESQPDDGRKFDTRELQKDMLQVEMDEASKTQIIERIKYGTADLEGPGAFDIKKTQYYQKPEHLNQTTVPQPGYQTGYQTGLQPEARPEIQFELQPEPKTAEIPVIKQETNVAAETPVYPEAAATVQPAMMPKQTTQPQQSQTVMRDDANMQERLKQLWDSNTAPIPVQSIPAQAAASYGEDKSEKTQGKATASKGEKSGGTKVIRFFIVLIILVLIIEGTVLGLRYFAPDSEATKRINYSITQIQDWVKDTFSGTADN